jgi:Succinylglutamate desuccinylase / Aspartoacylase family
LRGGGEPRAQRADDSPARQCDDALMRSLCGLLVPFAASFATAWPAASADGIDVPAGVATYAEDGRASVETLLRSVLALTGEGWIAETIVASQPDGTAQPLPIVALRTGSAGPAVWILAGIHGEEPAGPNAVAEAIDAIASLGRERPVVLLPLLNPHGYARNWRYLNAATYSKDVDGQSVGDSSHLLVSPDHANRARASSPSSPEAGAITAYLLRLARDYPPLASIDLHEDNLIDQGYVYSQGTKGADDPLAAAAVGVLRESGVPIKPDGSTRFDEPIAGGIVGPVEDSSIDELMSAQQVIDAGEKRPGPAARTVLVLETPAAALPLPRRVAAHAALLRRLGALLGTDEP